MKLWLLNANLTTTRWANPWDKASGFVVRAETEAHARQLASQWAGDEDESAWLDPQFSDCIELNAEGDSGIILRDFHAG